jgi:hypothetical protein
MIAPIIADKRAETRYQHASKRGVTRSNATRNRAPCQEFWGQQTSVAAKVCVPRSRGQLIAIDPWGRMG